jgi:hypothetical protein
MLLEITQEDIRLGVRGDGKRCPFVLACQRFGVSALSYNYPESLHIFQQKFDAGEKVSPIIFEYEPWDGIINPERAMIQRALAGV